MRSIKSLLSVVLAGMVGAIGLSSCGASNTAAAPPALSRSASDVYTFYFSMMPSPDPTVQGTYYVVDRGYTGEGLRRFEVAQSGEPITSYTEYTVSGAGPDGSGNYVIRVFNPLEYIWDTREDFFLVDGM